MGVCLDIFSLIYFLSFLSPSLWEKARYRLKYCLKGPLNPKQPTNQHSVIYTTPFLVSPALLYLQHADRHTLYSGHSIINCTYCLKLTIAYRLSATPHTCTAVTLPYFLYSWNRPSRKLVSESRKYKAHITQKSYFIILHILHVLNWKYRYGHHCHGSN